MTADIYTAVAEELARVGGIDTVGVVNAPGKTAILFAGTKAKQKYIRGPKNMSLIFQISGMDINARQEELVKKLTGIVNTLESAHIAVEGILNAKISVNNLPIPTVHNESHWIYTANVQIDFFMKG